MLDLISADFWVRRGEVPETASASVNNEVLQALCLKLGLDKYIRNTSAKDRNEIRQTKYEMAKRDKNNKAYWKKVPVSKVLADVVESIFGAVYLDSGMQLSVVADLYQRIHWPNVGRHLV